MSRKSAHHFVLVVFSRVLFYSQGSIFSFKIAFYVEVTVKELQGHLKKLKRTSASNSVAVALMSLQQQFGKRPPVFDPYRALTELESLVDLARDNADTGTKRFSKILHQFLPLLGNSQFQNILLKLVGDKEDVKVAKAIQKSLRPSTSPGPYAPCS